MRAESVLFRSRLGNESHEALTIKSRVSRLLFETLQIFSEDAVPWWDDD
jgi:hypothetical protein